MLMLARIYIYIKPICKVDTEYVEYGVGPNSTQVETHFKLEETLTQFMQISMPNYRSMESSIKNLEIQVGQLAKQMAERPTSSFGANPEKNPKEECKTMLTRSQRKVQGKEEKVEGDKSEEGRVEKEGEK